MNRDYNLRPGQGGSRSTPDYGRTTFHAAPRAPLRINWRVVCQVLAGLVVGYVAGVMAR